MFGLAAAPEIASAVPSVMPPPCLVAIFPRLAEAEPARGRPAVQRRRDERLRLAFLPREPFRVHHVERDVDDVERLPAPLVGGPELVHPDVVLLVEARERVWRTLRVRGSEESADQSIAVNGMGREPVDVHAAPGEERHDQDHDNADDQPMKVLAADERGAPFGHEPRIESPPRSRRSSSARCRQARARTSGDPSRRISR